MIISLFQDIVKQCSDFAEKRMQDSEQLYRLRGEDSTKKMLEDITVGALAEFAVVQYLREKGIEVSEPDLTIYETRKKSFAPDLMLNDGHVHVKSQTVKSAEKYGASWMFQKTDKTISVPSENGYFAFCIVDGANVDIKAIVSVMELVEANLIGIPKVPKYQLTKRTIYLNDVLNGGINLWKI